MNKPIFIKAVDTKEGVLVRYRDIDGKLEIKEFPFKNYFYVEQGVFQKIGGSLKRFANSFSEVKASNGRFVKINLIDNFKRYYAKKFIEDKGFKTFEADLTASKRYLLDNSDKYDFTGYRVCYLDFESDDRHPRGRNFDGSIKFGEEQLTGVAVKDKEGNEFFIRNQNADNHLDAKEEGDFLKELMYILKDYDIVTAFAGGWFDFEILKHRIKEHKEKYERDLENIFNLKLINKVDFQDLYKKYVYWMKHDSYSLNAIANDVLSDGKIDWSDKVTGEGLGRYYKLYQEFPETFKEYNIKDVEIMRLLDEKFSLFDIHNVVSNRVKNTPEECMHSSHMADTYLIRKDHSQGVICKSKPTEKEIEERKKINIGGGHIECVRGLYDNVLTYDYKSHYPLVASTWNISPETFVEKHPVDLNEVKDKFTNKEFEFLHLVKNEELNEKEMKAWLSKNEVNGLDVAMKFNRYYVGQQVKEYARQKNLLYTPADLNHSKVGWSLHYHRLFKNPSSNDDIGNLAEYMGGSVQERDKVKYLQKRKTKEDPNFEGSDEDSHYTSQSNALKIIGNSAYGFTGFRSTRYFMFDIADTITTCARWLIKKAINKAEDEGFKLVNTHTDSIYITKNGEEVDPKIMNGIFFDLYQELFKDHISGREFKIFNPKTGEEVTTNYWTVFEFEDKIDAIITSAKARYYYLTDGKVKTQGGAFKRREVNPLAKDIQKELCGDILRHDFDKESWIKKLSA